MTNESTIPVVSFAYRKTTTLVEAIYQLANLHNHELKILVVAPSNDATDILVEKLSQYFPPSEMVRVLAYTRSIKQVPENVRKYCTAGMEAEEVISKIMSVKITAATINMASRLWCTGDGLPKGHFDVLCVDEAGHATEPEVVAVASTIMEFHKQQQNGQLVLAGDPKQLGPIVTSELCKTFKMDRSYLERLVETSPAYNLENNSDVYPPQLVTLLVNNYRSHHQILKLPNEMFYRNELVANGDIFQTHSMTTWEHLPTKGFPIVFHAVDGENTREGTSPSWFNPQEAMAVVEYVKKLVEESKPKISPEDIGIITPYARQVQKIRLALKVSNIEDVKVGEYNITSYNNNHNYPHKDPWNTKIFKLVLIIDLIPIRTVLVYRASLSRDQYYFFLTLDWIRSLHNCNSNNSFLTKQNRVGRDLSGPGTPGYYHLHGPIRKLLAPARSPIQPRVRGERKTLQRGGDPCQGPVDRSRQSPCSGNRHQELAAASEVLQEQQLVAGRRLGRRG
jgi:hypothetical protein